MCLQVDSRGPLCARTPSDGRDSNRSTRLRHFRDREEDVFALTKGNKCQVWHPELSSMLVLEHRLERITRLQVPPTANIRFMGTFVNGTLLRLLVHGVWGTFFRPVFELR